MKKLIIGTLLLLSLSCQKEVKSCNCGIIIDDPIIGSNYALTIKNECSGNVQTFYFSYSVWLDSHVATRFCINNISSWIEVKENDSIVKFQKEVQ